MRSDWKQNQRQSISSPPGASSAGFTLFELLIVSSIIVLAGVMATNVFFASLRSAIRARIEARLQEKGQLVLEMLARMIRQANQIKEIDDRCPKNGKADRRLVLVDEKDNETTLICQHDQIASQSANQAVLIQGVKIENCNQFITCSWSGSGPPKIEIKFSLSLGQSSTSLPYQSAQVDFQTIVVPRNIR